ncbi:putative Ecp2 effector protein domain-containing protein [Seiridium cardinale]|uniref:Ecp2 effector protein domain-containing protein n=1 Tax=Seiridium cardinale TaxID=138064 RepID=A0ABR2XFY3_9PEZI
MFSSYITWPLMAIATSVVLGAPPSEGRASIPGLTARSGLTGMVDFGGKLDDSGNKVSRESRIESRQGPTGMVDFGGNLDDEGNKVSKRYPPLQNRDSDYISSCGKNWVPIDDFKNNERWYMGYREAVKLFCTHITSDYEGKAATVGPKAYAGTTIYTNDAQEQIGLDNGKKPSESVTPGHIEFEIHNKQKSGDHTPTLDNCRLYLMKMAETGQSCYGEDNSDTKGGTWQIGSMDISYHALPAKN